MENTVSIESHGRTFVIGKVGVGIEMRNTRVLSATPGLTQNAEYMAMAKLLSSVQMIDGIPVLKPNSPEGFEALGDKIGEALMDVTKAFAEVNGLALPEADGVEVAKN